MKMPLYEEMEQGKKRGRLSGTPCLLQSIKDTNYFATVATVSASFSAISL